MNTQIEQIAREAGQDIATMLDSYSSQHVENRILRAIEKAAEDLGFAASTAAANNRDLRQREQQLASALHKIFSYGGKSIIRPEDRSEMCGIAEAALSAPSTHETP